MKRLILPTSLILAGIAGPALADPQLDRIEAKIDAISAYLGVRPPVATVPMAPTVAMPTTPAPPPPAAKPAGKPGWKVGVMDLTPSDCCGIDSIHFERFDPIRYLTAGPGGIPALNTRSIFRGDGVLNIGKDGVYKVGVAFTSADPMIWTISCKTTFSLNDDIVLKNSQRVSQTALWMPTHQLDLPAGSYKASWLATCDSSEQGMKSIRLRIGLQSPGMGMGEMVNEVTQP